MAAFTELDNLAVNTLRALSIDASFKAKSGHPGAPMGMAPMAHVLFSKMKFNPRSDKAWINRDRFVLSNGHACALLYSLLHLYGYDLSLDDLKNFRQIHSKTPGHPELTDTPGVEVTTGPLGQGLANAVGLAIAQEHLAASYNKPGFSLFTNNTYVIFGDGCVMEGISQEAISLAGHLKLGKLIALYDDNHICIDGSTDSTFTEDVLKRFEACGWHTQHVVDGNHDLDAINRAIDAAVNITDKPSVIKVTTTIGYGSLLAGTAASHGSPLKANDIAQFKESAGISPEAFHVSEEVYELFKKKASYGIGAEDAWKKLYVEYKERYPELSADLERRLHGELPAGWADKLPKYTPSDAPLATRKTSEMVLDMIANSLPELLSGSADLTSSNLTRWKSASDFQAQDSDLGTLSGRYIRWGDKGACMNGIAAYGANLVPLGGTFLNFLSYASGAIRLSALSKLRVVWIATHDTIALGEDGPTHQPIESLSHYRAMPNMHVWRPADGNETSAAYLSALTAKQTPSIIALTRQPIPQLAASTIDNASKGGYVTLDHAKPDIILVSAGSEVSLSIEAAKLLHETHKKKARVVSIPCFEVFDQQDKDYRLKVLPAGTPILSVEAASTQGWEKYSHAQFGINRFGISAPCDRVFKYFDLIPTGVVERALKTIKFYDGVSLLSPLQRPFEQVV